MKGNLCKDVFLIFCVDIETKSIYATNLHPNGNVTTRSASHQQSISHSVNQSISDQECVESFPLRADKT